MNHKRKYKDIFFSGCRLLSRHIYLIGVNLTIKDFEDFQNFL